MPPAGALTETTPSRRSKTPASAGACATTAAGTSDDDKALRDAVRKELEGRMLLFGASNLIVANEFDHSIVMEQGRLAADGESEQ